MTSPGAVVVEFVLYLIQIYAALIVAWCFMTWLPPRKSGLYAEIFNSVRILVGPYLQFFSRIIPPLGGIDFSPIFAILVLEAIQKFIIVLF